MLSHSFPTPFTSDLAGDSDGGVIMYEFGNHTPLLAPRRQGAGGAITRIHYTPQGNKFGATDTHGSLFMWQGIQSNKKDAFVVRCCLSLTKCGPLKETNVICLCMQCHSKGRGVYLCMLCW